MPSYLPIGGELLQALVRLLLNPFYYIGLLFVVLLYRRQIILERKLYHVRLHSLAGETWRTILWGWGGGLAVSVVMAFLGFTLSFETVVLTWCISLLLMLVRVRYLCLAYAAGIIGLLRTITDVYPNLGNQQSLHPLLHALQAIDVPSLLALVAVLHFAEALLIRKQGHRLATPLFVESKRGKIVGAYQMLGFWPLPLFLLVPAGGDGFTLPWSTWLGFIAFPAVIGFTSLTFSRLPKDKARQNSSLLMLYAVLLLAAAVISSYWNPFAAVASVLAILLHEAMIQYSSWVENKRNPEFVHGDQGLKILAVLPGSPAEESGIAAGEMIHKVNGILVLTKEEFHKAMQINSAFCKLEILNLEGQSKFISKALYSDEHHQLGIILAPDDRAMHYVALQQPANLASFLRVKWMNIKSGYADRDGS
jgi:hypothetical protein